MPPFLSKTPFALKGAQSYEVFRFVKPPLSASLFVRERKDTNDSDIVKASYFLLPCSPTLKDPAYS
jgi:hypothetical protein